MKEFKLYVGLHQDHMTEVLHCGLKNDTVAETFAVRHVNNMGICFPTRFIKIVPLSAHGQSFHTSIWFVSLLGIADPSYVEQICARYDDYRESIVLRHVLKHLRQRRLLTPYHSILSSSNFEPEHPLVTSLYSHLVLQGNWKECESLFSKASEAGLFTPYIRACEPHAKWTRLYGVDADGDAPSKRGGHAMCLDPDNNMIYLFGGWDGQKSLDDFWVYDIKNERWKQLSHSTSLEKNGPVARSCHKMVYDTKSGCIYLLGRLGDGDLVRQDDETAAASQTQNGETSGGSAESVPSAPTPYCSEFYRYHTRGLDAGKWDLLTFDTASAGGPPLIFDHQMVMDCDAQILYYSGLYSYNVRTSKWKLLQSVLLHFCHSMVLDSSSHVLFIFAGQRDNKYLSDMYAYDITSNVVTELFGNFSTSGGPDACFTQRAVIDAGDKEIYYRFCGLTRAHQSSALTVLQLDAPNWVYRYENAARPGKWTQILPEVLRDGEEGLAQEPLPRYAHQVVYDDSTRTVFMHGGNAGEAEGADSGENVAETHEDDDELKSDHTGERDRPLTKETRLDDFWSMTLQRISSKEVVRRGIYQIRKQQFREMCEEQPAVKALRFLQTEVSAVVDHKSPKEASVFRSLLAHLLSPSVPLANPSEKDSSSHITVDESSDAEAPPKKRSRPNTPDEAWTNQLDEDDISTGGATSSDSTGRPSSPAKQTRAVLCFDEDPDEISRRADTSKPLLAERFKQRTETFEGLLELIGDDAKQPDGSLLDLVDVDNGL
ncbi:hypothetical protein SERLA73DRAFT_51827 [Serpula lacrymans var. lacrymans S7.3]|uniref:Muskelin N-terminal domain-containing protein n=1 Tax=Serpula lacrymans var. lacrymans (strain S7.3) TaxID=936435 RepID=F8PVT0_SERL3|nr:hypothetical protein SERLA73DRAFT_51827 [Serpula lacrymans var. lacrymans S7.3]